MKTTIILIMVALIATSAMAARVVNVPVDHPPFLVYQAYCGRTCVENVNGCFQGFSGQIGDTIEAVPGILCIIPGESPLGTPDVDWANYVTASQATSITWNVTNTSLRKTVPTYDCVPAIGGASVLQQGTANIRRWWPLMYELPGTKWVLTVTYRTAANWNDGFANNLPAATHQDTWTWQVDATLESLENLIKLFHELPVGSCQVPLISGEDLIYATGDEREDMGLLARIDEIEQLDPSDPNMAEAFNSLVLLIEDMCLTTDCGVCSPAPVTGLVGIRNTVENPACCKLLADADFIMDKLEVNIPGK